MAHIRVDYQRPPQPQPQARPRPAQPPAPPRPQTPHCGRHPGVHVVLAGSNPGWNTVRYLCPMCNALGLPLVEVATGVVSAWLPERGYGFIENGGPRIFVHFRDLVGNFTPYVGLPVTCVVEQNDKGLIGRQVRPR